MVTINTLTFVWSQVLYVWVSINSLSTIVSIQLEARDDEHAKDIEFLRPADVVCSRQDHGAPRGQEARRRRRPSVDSQARLRAKGADGLGDRASLGLRSGPARDDPLELGVHPAGGSGDRGGAASE